MKFLETEKNFLGIEKEYSGYDNSRIVILQAPLEKTVSYGGGTARGPEEILNTSHYVELYDEETDRELCFEKGICTLETMNFEGKETGQSIGEIYNEVKKLIAGPGVYICDECIELCNEIVLEGAKHEENEVQEKPLVLKPIDIKKQCCESK